MIYFIISTNCCQFLPSYLHTKIYWKLTIIMINIGFYIQKVFTTVSLHLDFNDNFFKMLAYHQYIHFLYNFDRFIKQYDYKYLQCISTFGLCQVFLKSSSLYIERGLLQQELPPHYQKNNGVFLLANHIFGNKILNSKW